MTAVTNLGARAILRVIVACGKITRDVRLVHWTIVERADGVLVDHVRSNTAPRFPAHYTSMLERAGLIARRRIFWEPTAMGRAAC